MANSRRSSSSARRSSSSSMASTAAATTTEVTAALVRDREAGDTPDRTKRPKTRSTIQDEDDDDTMPFTQATFAPLRKLTMAPRAAQYCIQLCFPAILCCPGCVAFSSSKVRINIDDRLRDDDMTAALQQRHHTHKSRDYKCLQLWKMTTDPRGNGRKELREQQRKFIRDIHRIDPDRLELFTIASVVPPAIQEPRTVTPTNETATEATMTNAFAPVPIIAAAPPTTVDAPVPITDDAPSTATKPRAYKRRTYDQVVETKSGEKYTVTGIPSSHTVVSKSELQDLRCNYKEKVLSLQQQFNRERFSSKVSRTAKAYLVMAMVSAPALAIRTLANILPLIAGFFLYDTGLLPPTTGGNYGASFPSERYLRDLMLEFAAIQTLMNAEHLRDPNVHVYLACDKGNKNGMDHFIKYLCYRKDGRTWKFLLDCDPAPGTDNGAGDAIKVSLRKVKGGPGGNFLLNGHATDGGGGGVYLGLGRRLKYHGCCSLNYLMDTCSIHNVQLQLSVPTKTLVGEGGVDSRNTMQLLHCINDIQRYLSIGENQYAFDCARKFADEWCDKNLPMEDVSAGDKEFNARWNVVRALRSFGRLGAKTKYAQCPECILTRWGYVGKASVWGWTYYLLLLRLTQVVINTYKTDSNANKAASTLQALLANPRCFSDLAMMHDFHECYFNSHLAWMMDSTDLQGDEPGFQKHQMATRYFLMTEDLLEIKQLLTQHDGFKAFAASLDNLEDPDVRAQHTATQEQWIDTAIEKCKQHFKNNCSRPFIGASLMAELPLAKVVARVILKSSTNRPVNGDLLERPTSQELFHSTVHKRIIDLDAFEDFITLEVPSLTDDDPEDYLPQVLVGAELLLLGKIDLRDLDVTGSAIRAFLHSRFLPFPSHTQFVEVGVKLSGFVGKTKRLEEMRSCYAIVRDGMVLTVTKPDQTAEERVSALLLGVLDYVEMMDKLEASLQEYEAELKTTKEFLHSNHYKHELDAAKVEALEKGDEKNKKQNVRQRDTEYHETAANLSLILYSDLRMKENLDDLKIELKHRGATDDDIASYKTFTAMRNKLKQMEVERLDKDGGTENAKERAKKGFEKQSAAPFKLKD